MADFPERTIRVLFGSGREATNDKVAKLARLAKEARYETLVINDSDVRAEPSYLRTVVAPLADPEGGAVTCFYAPTDEKTLVQKLQTIGMYSDFYPGIVVAWQLDGVKFALGPTIATSRARLAGFGGYEMIENRPADDLLVGRLIAEQGYEVKLIPYSVLTVADFQSLRDLFLKRLRWIVVMRHMRPWGHLGLIFTLGIAVVSRGHRHLPYRRRGGRFSRNLSRPARRHDAADRVLGTQAACTVAGLGADSGLGRHGIRDLAGELHPQHNSLARSRLLHPKRRTRSRGRRQLATRPATVPQDVVVTTRLLSSTGYEAGTSPRAGHSGRCANSPSAGIATDRCGPCNESAMLISESSREFDSRCGCKAEVDQA